MFSVLPWVTVAASWALPGGSSLMLALISVRELLSRSTCPSCLAWLQSVFPSPRGLGKSPTAKTCWVVLAHRLGGGR